MKILAKEIKETLWRLELVLPLFFFTISLHLLLHLSEEIADVGPIHAFWMFGVERLFYLLHRSMHSRKVPQVTVLREYRLMEVVHRYRYLVVAHAGSDVGGRHEDDEEIDDEDEDLYTLANASAHCSFMAEVQLSSSCDRYELTPIEVKGLGMYLAGNHAGYMELCRRFESSDAARNGEPLSTWHPSDAPPLNATQRFLRRGFLRSGKLFKRAILNGTLLRGERFEERLKTSRSGVKAVYTDDDGSKKVCYGRAQFFLLYRAAPFADYERVNLAYIHWWKVDHTDQNTGLPIVRASAQRSFFPL